MGCTISYLASGIPKGTRENIEGARRWVVDFIVGTHSVISDDVKMKALGLAIVDEEHKFGVDRRRKFGRKQNKGSLHCHERSPIPEVLRYLYLIRRQT